MANESYLKILEQGAAAWNTWREQADLRAAHPLKLDRADLRGANLMGAYLAGAKIVPHGVV